MTLEQTITYTLNTHRQVPEDALSANIRGMCVECREGPWTAEHAAEKVLDALDLAGYTITPGPARLHAKRA